MTGTELSLWLGIGTAIAGVGSQALWMMRRFTQNEERVTSSINALGTKQTTELDALKKQASSDMQALAASTTASLQRLESATEQKFEHANTIAEMRHDEQTRRIGALESQFDKITKVVIFDGEKTK